MLELNVSNIGRAAANQSYSHFFLRVSGSSNVKVDNKSFIRLRDIVALKTGGPALSESNVFKSWWFIPNRPRKESRPIKARNSRMFVGFIHGYFEDHNQCSLCLVRVSVLFLIFSFVLLSIKENISSSKSKSKSSSIVSTCFAVPSRIECLPPGLMSHGLCSPEH